MQCILTDLRSFFKNTTNYKKRYDDFRDRKFCELEIHETITKIALNISKEPALVYNLVDNSSLFSIDLIGFLKKISTSNNDKAKFFDKLTDGKLKVKNPEVAMKIIVRIVENTIHIIYNLINSPDQVANKFVDKVNN